MVLRRSQAGVLRNRVASADGEVERLSRKLREAQEKLEVTYVLCSVLGAMVETPMRTTTLKACALEFAGSDSRHVINLERVHVV